MPVIESKIKDSPFPNHIYINMHTKISFASVFIVFQLPTMMEKYKAF